MILREFRTRLVVRTLLLTATLAALVLLLHGTRQYTIAAAVAGLAAYQVYGIFRLTETTNQLLGRFLAAVKYGDFSQTFKGKDLGRDFGQLTDQFNQVMATIRQTRSEKEEQYRYLQTVLRHVGVGLISYRDDGNVHLINGAARRLLGISRLKNIKALSPLSPLLVETLFRLKAGQGDLVRVDGKDLELALHAVEFRLKGRPYTLVSLQNIKRELEDKEMEAWQNLIRVLTHEIMNSMTPIASMTATLLELLAPDIPELDDETLADFRGALKTIHKRSLGLTDFVNAYRDLTLIPQPRVTEFSVTDLFARVETLLESRLKTGAIALRRRVEPPTLRLVADPGLIEQVLINLVLNAVDALQGTTDSPHKAEIILSAGQDDTGRVVVRVADNGPGIVDEALPKVFIPFFSTKKEGSGIGLSLARQILKLHGGSIGVHSEPNVETVFTLKF